VYQSVFNLIIVQRFVMHHVINALVLCKLNVHHARIYQILYKTMIVYHHVLLDIFRWIVHNAFNVCILVQHAPIINLVYHASQDIYFINKNAFVNVLFIITQIILKFVNHALLIVKHVSIKLHV
jgi:hypothetical protein